MQDDDGSERSSCVLRSERLPSRSRKLLWLARGVARRRRCSSRRRQRPAGGPGGAAGSAPDPRAEALRCPRCDSANTKFCYYNNYSLSQPRHFCKACKRYWTRGGTLRNVPVGGGCRKNKRSRTNSAAAAAAAGRTGGASAAGASAAATSSSALSLPVGVGGTSATTMQSLTSALGLSGGASLASLLLSGGGDHHLGLFQAAMQSVVSDTTYEMQQQHQHQAHHQVDHLLGLGYGGSGAQIQLKPWTTMQQQQDAAGGIMDSFYAPLLSGSLVPGLEELHVKAEAAGAGGDHHQSNKQAAAGGEQNNNGWDQLSSTPSSSNIDANIIASDALMAAAAASMAPAAVSSASTAAPSSFMYWGNGGGIGGAAGAWPDLANCGSSIATLF
ncbi:hypothetical protein PR202_ga29884 [Eleusine coracana subsp. coracana]|uniref:Dof zinc finger protein n=1 Tax=Eleusine coracana subsp. coracana TaxID=191504 RepID=A0AAV5DMJ7_ELECO|nr:hypothetical protein PR202_ga29884 [Eleusine coracana subsp. coracana]